MPGLINMHTHFSLSLPGAGGDAVSALDAHELALYMADGARRTLLSGVTTVRCVAEKSGADFALRRAIEAGHVPGPRIFTAGKALCCSGGHGHDTDDTLECDGADAFARGVRRQVKAGADLIKLMISGGIAGENEQITTPQLTRDEMAAAISTAHAWGRKVTAHAGPAAIIAEAVELGLDCVEHGYELTPEVAAADGRTRRRTRPHPGRHPRGRVLRRPGRAALDAGAFAGGRAAPPGVVPVRARRGRRDAPRQRHAAVLGLRGHERCRARTRAHAGGRAGGIRCHPCRDRCARGLARRG